MTLEFSVLSDAALRSYLNFHCQHVELNVTRNQLIAQVASHFGDWMVKEEDVVGLYTSLSALTIDEEASNASRKRRRKNALTDVPAKRGEQVAAKISMESGKAAWILAGVINYNLATRMYEVKDEDDDSTVQLPPRDVIRLEDEITGLNKGDRVLAVFPDTTSFYKAIISKDPAKTNLERSPPYEVWVKFEDDEDESGKTPHRRILAMHVVYEPSEEESARDVGEPFEEDSTPTVRFPYETRLAECLEKLPQSRGTLEDILSLAEKRYSKYLNYTVADDGEPQWRADALRALMENERFVRYRDLERPTELFFTLAP